MDMTWKSYWSQRPHMRTQKSKDKLMLHRLESLIFTKTHFEKLNKVFYDTLNQLFEDRIIQIDIQDLEKWGTKMLPLMANIMGPSGTTMRLNTLRNYYDKDFM